MSDRPTTTLFMLSSVDGKISTGPDDYYDFDRDLPKISEISDGLNQYYEIEKTTDIWSLNSGKTLAKIGINNIDTPNKSEVNYVVIDNQNLTQKGLSNLIAKSNKCVLITSNEKHIGYHLKSDNFSIINTSNLAMALETLKREHGCDNLTIQTGATLNNIFLKNGLIDYVHLIVAPILIGGKDTPTLIDGDTFTLKELENNTLNLICAKQLKGSYLELKYKVNNKKVTKDTTSFFS